MHDSLCIVNVLNVIVWKYMALPLLMKPIAAFYIIPAVTSYFIYCIFLVSYLSYRHSFGVFFTCTSNEESGCAVFGHYFWDTLCIYIYLSFKNDIKSSSCSEFMYSIQRYSKRYFHWILELIFYNPVSFKELTLNWIDFDKNVLGVLMLKPLNNTLTN